MHYLNDKYNFPILFFFHTCTPEKYEFYLYGLRKPVHLCFICWCAGVVTDLATVQSSLIVCERLTLDKVVAYSGAMSLWPYCVGG